MLQRLWEWLNSFWEWLWGLISDFVLFVFSSFLQAVIGLFSLIPVPSWAEGLDLSWIPSGMGYFLEPFNLPLAVTAITGGYLIRFIIRRLPVVG